MHLYNLTIQHAGGITHAVQGNFSGTRTQEILLSHGKSLELLKLDTSSGKIQSLLATEVFGIIRSISVIRPTGAKKDYAVIGSDSGYITILEYDPNKNTFERVCRESFGKSGCRRKVPGQYLAVDPKGRAIMIGAVENKKLIYTLTWDANGRLALSLPLDLQKANTLTYDMISIDIDSAKPIFACLEIDYTEADADLSGEAARKTQQSLVLYELDLVLNSVARKYSEPLENRASCLVPVPGGKNGPSGVLLFTENYVTYKHLGFQHDVRCPIPRRRNDIDDVERGMIIICCATHRVENAHLFFVQTEQGDIFRITLKWDKFVSELRLKYFDTVPPAAAMCVLSEGFLFVAAEFGNHYLYQITSSGDNIDEPEYSSAIPIDEGDTFFFAPHSLKNLLMIDELKSFAPIIGSYIGDLAKEKSQQMYLLCGRGPRSSVRVLRHGMNVTEMAICELHGNPNAVWTLKKRIDDQFDSYIIVSFVNATLVLSVGEIVDEVTDSGFLCTTSTLNCSSFGYNGLIQIHSDGVRHIRSDKSINEWKSPGKKTITKCAVNRRQIVIALSGKELIYFEMDSAGEVKAYAERKELPVEITGMALGDVSPGQQRSRLLALLLVDNTVRILTLDPSNCLAPRSMHALPSAAESVCLVDMGNLSSFEEGQIQASASVYLNIGLNDGTLLQTFVNSTTGDLSEFRTRSLGSRPVRLFKIKIQGHATVLATSSRSWLSYYYHHRFHSTPLCYEPLDFASGFSSELCRRGIISITSNTLRILALEKLGVVFNQIEIPLEHTPRRFAIHRGTGRMLVVDADHNAYTEESKTATKKRLADDMRESAKESGKELANQVADALINDVLPEKIFSAPKAGPGMWACQLKIIDLAKGQTVSKVQLKQNETIVSMAIVKFTAATDGSCHLVIGVVKELKLDTYRSSGNAIDVYKIDVNCSHLEFLHRTEVEAVPGALCDFQGRLVAGMGKVLRIYDLGKKKLLRKCENKHFPHQIVNIRTMGPRIYVSDAIESVLYAHYKREENQIIVFADDILPRWITATELLDYDTIATADKYGNIAVLRLPIPMREDVEDDESGMKATWNRALLSGLSQKLDNVCTFHAGDMVMSLQKAKLSGGGSESLIYSTLSGAIGALIPFKKREDYEFFSKLESEMRNENPPLCGRNHLSYRSWYYIMEKVVDGDLCEQFTSIDSVKQRSIALSVGRTPLEVVRKLEDIRSRYLF